MSWQSTSSVSTDMTGNDNSEVIAEYTIVPIGRTGYVDLPRFKAWEILETPIQEQERLQHLQQQQGRQEMDDEDDQYRDRDREQRQRQQQQEIAQGPRTREMGVFREDGLLQSAAGEGEGMGESGMKAMSIYVLPR